ncbi:MAG: OmpA family protein [Myxococcota bacterium]|nr:OmpA family protein [Myxococcota bacterium]
MHDGKGQRAKVQRNKGGFLAILSALSFALIALSAPPALAQTVPPGCPSSLGTADLIDHDFTVSFCELCSIGTVNIVIKNPTSVPDEVDLSEIIVREDLGSSGLTYVAGSTTFTGTNVTAPAVVEPTVAAPNGSRLTWTLPAGFTLEADAPGPGNRESLAIEFNVERHSNFDEEGLVTANRSIEAEIEATPSCALGDRFTTDTGTETLPLREPEPDLSKGGRNIDAAQGGYASVVYGHENDDVIWRIRVRNDGNAPLQDVLFDDSIVPGNYVFDWACDDEGDAEAAAGGAAPAGCVSLGGTTNINDFDVAQEFGGGANPYIVAPAGGRGFYYFVGRVTDSCRDRTNTVNDGEWGCQVDTPAGGISLTSGGSDAGDDDDPLRTDSQASGVDVGVAYTGIDTAQPMGATGFVTITIDNNSNGTIKGETGGLRLNHLLPAEYVIDPTFTPTISMNPRYGTYDGMIDTIQWTNPQAGTVPLTSSDPADPLANSALDFLLTSSTVHPDFADQIHMIRHGDEVTITFRTVLVDPTDYDLTANIDVREESPTSSPANTDPIESFTITSQTELWWEEYCTATLHNDVIVDNDTAVPEDLDPNIVGSELLFILTSTGDPLSLSVELTNNGGHDADDYFAYVTFGEAMVVQTAPAGCSATTNPPAMPNWTIPANLPATASVYVCDRGAIGPGATETLTFEVVKNTALSFDDDLTFRVDVIGEITLSDGTPLWFPAPSARSDGITDRANDYSLDALRARVVGYDLLKSQAADCSENNPPPGSPDDQIEIGEECSFSIESGGWFGFQTPGFSYIAVQNVQVVDGLPDGQGYISSTDPLLTSTSAIAGVSLNPPPSPLDEGDFDWTFNTVVPAERITQKDHWFRAEAVTRMLNDPIDTSALPNEHAEQSSNILTSTFEVVFFNALLPGEETFTLGPSTIGYPREVHRRVDLTVTEPSLTVTKEVCNETLYGSGAACSNFVALADDGDAFDTYVYRITVSNAASTDGVVHAPAYDVTVTSVADPSDQLFVELLTGDGVDNDGDAFIDGADAGGEGTISDNVLENLNPAQVIASHTHSDALLKIDAGDSVVLYYRVDPLDDVAPLETLTNSVSASYDSLEGASGNQSAPLGTNGQAGGARQFTTASAEATIQIIPVEVDPKAVIAASNSALATPPTPQPVSIGEEVEFQLHTMIPVAQLRSFTVRDELPAGIRCVEAPDVDLDSPPYDAAGFSPGGTFTPTCTDSLVEWDFGDQTVTAGAGGGTRFDFEIDFVARVDNVAGNQEGTTITNGGTATVAEVRYVDEDSNPVVIPIDEAVLVVREPAIDLTKAFSVVEADADDIPRVTVTATNNGTATAYNLRVLDDLDSIGLSYEGDIQGALPPTADVITFGADQPLFTWAPGFGIDPGDTVTFSFEVQVNTLVGPLSEMDNTIQADWTSLPTTSTALNATGMIGADGSATGMRIGALPNAAEPLNDYEAEADATLPVPGLTITKTDLTPALLPQIGAHKSFEVRIDLPEGMTENLVVADSLDFAAVSYVLAHNGDYDITYQFDGIATINGVAPSEVAMTSVPGDATSGTATWTIGTVVTQTEDDLTTTAIDPAIRITYAARINNDLVTDVGDALQNSAEVSYTNGETGSPETMSDTTALIMATEPNLTSTKASSNATPGKDPDDPIAFGDTIEYLLSYVNGGDATAYDLNIVDTLPDELTFDATFTPTATINGVPVVGFVAMPSGPASGPLNWGRGQGDETLDIPAGGFLQLTYHTILTTPTPDPETIQNTVWGDWTSLDGASVYERTGDGCPTVTAPDDYCFGPALAVDTTDPVLPPDPLLKENTQSEASVGEAFRYRITVPETPYDFPIYDLKIYDDLSASAADLRFIEVDKISGSGSWTPVNTGDSTNLVIEDTTTGIDIPAMEQVVVEITVVLEDTPTNTSGLSFTNTAWYAWNWFDDDDVSERPGNSDTTGTMTIVGPDTMTLQKSGPATMTIGTPETFSLDVQNTGTGTAWNLTIIDQLPSGAAGGTCDVAPTNVSAEVFESNGTTTVSGPLVRDTDYSLTFAGDPTCEITIEALSTSAAVGASERFIVSYETSLDNGSQDAVVLTNVAGTTQWYSTDGSDAATAGDRRSYTRTITDGTVGTLDHEDAHSTSSALPLYRFEKTVSNLTQGTDPASEATPGDTLRYRIEVENTGATPLQNITLFDEPDRLNGAARFVPGSLSLVTVPGTADSSNTSATGGTHGSGVIDIRDLDLPNLNDTAVIEYDITLAAVIAVGTTISNQAELQANASAFASSDDPAVNGSADPLVAGDEDPTSLTIVSMPVFQVEKVSTDLDGDPLVLLAGERLRYTITIKNIGTDDAVDAMLRDAIPVNTRYVAGSTTLNGGAVADGAGGVPAFVGGMAIYAPEDPTPGAMRADASATTDNVATLVFDVTVDADVVDGTVISNQAFVSAVTGGAVDTPSDDPDTAVPNDPTRDTVGSVPLLFASKAAALYTDAGTIGVVDPGDILEYTIVVYNNGTSSVTAVELQDDVPANTTYVDDTVTLNGIALGQPDGGTSPLIASIPISSSDLTPPLPATGMGVLSPGESATVTFRLEVDAGTPAGTLISNQATVMTAETANLLTDGDGDPATGPEPTIVVVGAGQQLAITKQVSVVGGGAAVAGAELEYVVRIDNIATVTASDVVISDDLDDPVAGQLSYVASSATLNGATAGVTVVGSLITADYSTTNGPLAVGGALVLRFRATLDAGLATGTNVRNTASVEWNAASQTESASVDIAVGGMPGVGTLNGALWHDVDFDETQGGGETTLAGWFIDLYRNSLLVQTVTADAAGAFTMAGLAPNDSNGDVYSLSFRAADATSNSASIGNASSAFTDGPQQITDLMVPGGSNLLGLDLPIQPNGVVYSAVERTPIRGASLVLEREGGVSIPSSCFDDPDQQGQVTRADGFYKFDLNFSAAVCSGSANYVLRVSPPASGFAAGDSQIIPPTSSPGTTAFDVPGCPTTADDAVPATTSHCEVQASALAPPTSVAATSPATAYHTFFTLDEFAPPGSAQIFNNHVALDPSIDSAVGLTKTTPLVNVSIGELVPYEITLINGLATTLPDLSIVDRYPAGFRYIEGSARIDGVPTEPDVEGHVLTWPGLTVEASGRRTAALLLAVGAGVTEGEFTNRAQALTSSTGVPLTGEASATVRVVPDPDFACTDVLGKVFDDHNGNGVQDEGEAGLSSIRLVTPRGLAATTDAHGRYHITCAVVPKEGRGSNFALKLDERTLPTGYRLTTRGVNLARATRGKALKLNFGATIDRVVSLDLIDAVFRPGSTLIREQWIPRLDRLIEELEAGPSILRLSYVADVEDAGLVGRRLDAMRETIESRWTHEPLRIENDVFWRLGQPATETTSERIRRNAWDILASPFASTRRIDGGSTVEQQLPADASYTAWAQDEARLEVQQGDRLSEREVLTDVFETVKLKNVVPPIHFASGQADIPPTTIETLRLILDGMRHLEKVRIHLTGHSDNQPLSGKLAARYGDNEGLSRERAGKAAELIQRQLALGPDAISYEWAGDAHPLESNDTEPGRARNRRVEIEVWYDEPRQAVAVEDVVTREDIQRVKVCRAETVCKMRFREGHARRARVKNLIAPLRYSEKGVGKLEPFIAQISRALGDLSNKQNVTVKLVGYSDDAPLAGRSAQIYGDHLALSKARARRVALSLEDALGQATAAVESDGRGAARPVASNDNELGRALNRRIEVEFWYDDPLQDLPDEPQVCPDAGDAEWMAQVYDPVWGRIAPLPLVDGEARISPSYLENLKRALADVAGRTRPRLRFVGYTSNERLDRRTAVAYGDDIGLSTARAQRVMQAVQAELGLEDDQVEHEGRGYVYSNDVVNGGFIEGAQSQVAVQVVYDEASVLDDLEGVSITPITREIVPRSVLELNVMRISVDGQPIDDPGRSHADIARCTDVALSEADVKFRFDALTSERRLSVTVESGTVALAAEPGSSSQAAGPARFRMDTNYPHFIARAEVRIFEAGDSMRSEPLVVLPIEQAGVAEWQPEASPFASPKRELAFVLRAYDAEGRFDETAPQTLWIVKSPVGRSLPGETPGGGPLLVSGSGASDAGSLFAGYGESGPLLVNIPLDSAGTVRVHGTSVPEGHRVWLAGRPVPVDERGEFVAEAILPSGLHTVEVNIQDEEGRGDLFLRDLDIRKEDWFYVGIADVTFSLDKTNGPKDRLEGENQPFDSDPWAEGRLAFFLTGKFAEDWKLTASADTREGSVDELFSNFLDKSPDSLFRRIDPDYHYPTFGDDGTVEELAPTLGKFYVKLSKDESHLMWGNFNVGYRDNELALVERGLYGGKLHAVSNDTTSFGEKRYMLGGFAADPGTVRGRDEFRGTGGSLYYLRNRDLLNGSETLRIELRDKDSGLVSGVVDLRPGLDYDIDYFQGRILLSEPMASTVADELLIRSDGLSGYESWLVAQYEYTPGFDELDTLSTGGRAHAWLGDFLKLGVTANRNDDEGERSELYATDLTLRMSSQSWLKLQAGRSEGQLSFASRSDDGGFEFEGGNDLGLENVDAYGYRADISLGFADALSLTPFAPLADRLPVALGRLDMYAQFLDAGYSAPGLTTLVDTEQFGGNLELPITQRLAIRAKADHAKEDRGLETTTMEVDVDFALTDEVELSAGVRRDEREDRSPVVPETQEEGDRTDAVVQAEYDPGDRWRSYVFGQTSLEATGNREKNWRSGAGGEVLVTERLSAEGEASHGELGPAARVGTNFQKSDRTNVYLNYTLENERGANGVHTRTGNLVGGANSRMSDSASVYMENRYQHSKPETGLTRAVGMTLTPTERWTIGANLEVGTLKDRRTSAETERIAAGASVGYHFDEASVTSGVEFRYDDIERPDASNDDRTSWLFKNGLRVQLTDDWRLLAKFNHAMSHSSLGDFFDADYTEAVLGYAYRPVANDRLNALLKYTYFYSFPSAEQANSSGTASASFVQRSHVFAVDAGYDITRVWTLGGKYAYRSSQVSLDRDDPKFFENDAHLYILRSDLRLFENWESTVEGRMLDLPDLDERKSGALVTLNRYFGEHFKVGLGYNFTDFSEDLTDLDYDDHGWFLNMVGSF